MCDQTQVSYLPGDIVWVKLSSLWWPAEVQDPSKLDEEVTSGLKKQPLAIVKFFNEDAYEYPKNLDQIYHYNCLKKDEFIKKGLDLVRAAASKTPSRSVPSSIDKFPADVSMAEEKTNGDPQYINNPKFAHLESNSDDTKEDAPSEAKQTHKRSRISTISSPNLTTPSPRAKFSIKKLTPKTISKNNLSGGKTPSSLSRKNKHIKLNASNLSEPKFTCYICESFEAQHTKCLFAHIAAHYMGDLSKRPPVIPRRYLNCFNENEKRRSQKPSEPEIPKSQEKRKRKKSEELVSKKSLSSKQLSDSSFPPKKRNKKPNTPPPEDKGLKQEVALEILKDWSDSDDEVELKKDSGTKPDTSSPLKSSHSPKSVTTTPTKAEKSCFDFEDNEDSLNVDGALKFGQKLPRVLHEKHSTNRLRTSSKSDENQDELSKQVDNFLETINVPNVPAIPDTITSLKEDVNTKSGKVESETTKKKTNSTNKILKSPSQEEYDSLKKKKSDASPATESVSSLSPVKQKHPVKRSLSSTEKDSKQASDEPKDKKARKKYQGEPGEVPENIEVETKETKMQGKESEQATDNKGDTSYEENHKENKKKETLASSFADEKINNSSPHFLSINEVKMKPPEKLKKSSKSDHKKEFHSDKQVSKSGKTHSESHNREKHDRKVKTKEKDLDLKNENQKSPSKSDKHGAAKISKESMPEKADHIEQSTKHCSDHSTKDVLSKSKLETDKSPKKVEHSSKHEKGGKHKSEMETTASEKGDKTTKQSSAKLVEQESGKTTQQNSEKLVKVKTDKSDKKQDKFLEKDHHSIQKKQEKIKRVEKHSEKEKKLDSKDKHDIKKKLENEKSKSDSKKLKKHKAESNENTSISEQNKNPKKIKKSTSKESMKVDHKSDKKSNQTDSAKESVNSFAIDLEKKASHRKSEDVEVEPHPSEKKNVGDLNVEKTFIKTSSSTFLSEPDIQTDFDHQLEDSNVSSRETCELPCHPSSTTTTKQDAELAASSSMPTAQEVCQEPVTTSSDLGIEELITTLNTNSDNVELLPNIEQPPLPEHSLTQPESPELLPSQSLEPSQDNSSKDLKEFGPSEGINEIIKNQEKECLVSTSLSEPLNETSKEKSQLEQTEINSSPLEKRSNISKESDQPSELKNDVSENMSSLKVAAEQSTAVNDGATVELDPQVQQSEILSEPLTVNTGKPSNEVMCSESKIECSSNLLGEITSAPCDLMTESNFVQTVVTCEASEKVTSNSDCINGTLDLDIKSMPIDIDIGKEEGPNLEIMVGLQPFETVPGARMFEVHLRRLGEPFPQEIEHLGNITLPYDSKKSEYSNQIYGLKKVPFPKYYPEDKDDNTAKEDTSYINDFNNNPKKLIIPLGTLNLQDDDRLSTNVKLDYDSKATNPLKASDKLALPKQVLVTMPRNIQAEHFKVPNQGSKFTAKGTGKVLVCNSRTQIKNFTPGRMILPQSSLVTTSKPIKQFSISKNAGAVQSKPTNILLNGSSIHSIQVTGNVQHIIPIASPTKQIEKETPTTAKLQHSPTKKTLPKHSPNLIKAPKKTGRQFVLEKNSKIPGQSVETSASTNSPTVVCNLQTPGSDQVLLLDLGKPTKVIRVQNPKSVIKTSGQDILAEAIANTNVLQSDLDGSEFVGTSLSNNVLETSLTLNQPPIMSPLEVPSSVTSPSVPILATDQPTIYLTTPYVIDSSTPIVLAPAGDSSGIEAEEKLVFSGVTEQQKVAVSEDKDNVLPEFLKGDFSKKSPKKCDSSNNR